MADDIERLKQEVADLQSQVAFQEDTLKSLDDALARQQQEIIVLRRQLELVRQQQLEQAARHDTPAAGSLLDEKPPHY